jgi:hypothetical protein
VQLIPLREHGLDLDPEVKDPLGDPVCALPADKENEPLRSAYANGKIAERLCAAALPKWSPI